MGSVPTVLAVNTERGWRGGEQQLYLLARGVRERGEPLRLLTVCRAGEPLAERLARDDLPVLPIPASGPLDLRAVWRIRQALRRHGAGLVHAHASHAHALALHALRGTRIPLMVTRRVDFAVGGSPFGRRKYGPRVARFVAVSDAVAGVLARGGVPRSVIRTIHDGIDPARVQGGRRDLVRRELGLDERHLLALCPAALVAHKGHRHLLDAWRAVEERGPDATLLLAGVGNLEGDLRAQVQCLGLRRVVFAGWRDDIADLHAAADLAVLASVEEGLGSALMDAAAAGLPVVATRAGGIPEVVRDGVTGLLAPPGDAPALAAHLLALLNDAVRRHRLGAAARDRAAQHFGYERMVDEHLKLWCEVLAA